MVTGACGFLGKRLVRLLLEEENMAEIRLVDKHVQPQLVETLKGKIGFYATRNVLMTYDMNSNQSQISERSPLLLLSLDFIVKKTLSSALYVQIIISFPFLCFGEMCM